MKGSTSEAHRVATTRTKSSDTPKVSSSNIKAASRPTGSTARVRRPRVRKDGTAGQPVSNINHAGTPKRRTLTKAVPEPTYAASIFGVEPIGQDFLDLEKTSEGWQLNEVVFMAMLITFLLMVGFVAGKVF